MSNALSARVGRATFALIAGLGVAIGGLAAAPIALADNDDDDLVNEKLQPLDEGDEGIQPLGNNGTWDNPKLVVSPCEGSTEFDYSADMSYNGSLPTGVNLPGLWGERYEAYVRGESVPLYGFDGKGLVADPPLCVVREVDGDPQSEWSYCTDRASGVCGSYDLDGDIVDADPSTKPPTVSGDVGGQIDLEDGNPRLDEDQQQALMFLLANEVTIPDSAWDWFGGDYYD